MNDKRDLGLGVVPMIEWCARYGAIWAEGDYSNWELYVGNKIVAYNYNVEDGYIIKYIASGSFLHKFRLDVSFCHSSGIYNLTKKYV